MPQFEPFTLLTTKNANLCNLLSTHKSFIRFKLGIATQLEMFLIYVYHLDSVLRNKTTFSQLESPPGKFQQCGQCSEICNGKKEKLIFHSLFIFNKVLSYIYIIILILEKTCLQNSNGEFTYIHSSRVDTILRSINVQGKFQQL